MNFKWWNYKTDFLQVNDDIYVSFRPIFVKENLRIRDCNGSQKSHITAQACTFCYIYLFNALRNNKRFVQHFSQAFYSLFQTKLFLKCS